MTNEKVKSLNLDLSNLDKYIFNTIFLIIFVYMASVSYYRKILILNELDAAAMFVGYVFLGTLILSRILSYQNKSALVFENNLWCFYKGNRRTSFELSEISSVRKSSLGLFSSFLVQIGDTQIRIPAESPKLGDFIRDLSQHLSKEQLSDFLKYHNEALAVSFETEKSAKFMRIFCFFIPVIAFFTARNIWESFAVLICIIWTVISIILPIIWTAVNWLLLKITVGNFSVFQKVSGIWALAGILLYMIIGIAYREFYLWVIYLYRG